MALHMSRQSRDNATVSQDFDYVSQYKQYVKQLRKHGRMNKFEAASELKKMERTLLKADDMTRTKGNDMKITLTVYKEFHQS